MENIDIGSLPSCLSDQTGQLHPEISTSPTFSNKLVFDENIESLNAAFAAFKEAEDYIKKSEISVGELDIPSVNELRYFGYHLVKALSDPQLSRSAQLEEIHRAKKHAQRASYDAIELGLISNLEVIADFHMEYGAKPYLIEVHSDYYTLMTRVEEIKQLVGQESRHDRAEYYKTCESYLRELSVIKNRLELSKCSLANKEQERQNAEIRLQRAEARARKANWITFASLIVTIASLLFTLVKKPEPIPPPKSTTSELKPKTESVNSSTVNH